MFDEVLIATDGSTSGTRAARTGVELAETFDASTTVLVATGDELSEDDAEAVVDDVREVGASTRVRVRTRVVDGDPRPAIVEAADDVDADLVVMGRHGHSGVRERILGSVTEQVLRSCDRPVLTVHADGAEVGDYERVLVPTDASDASRAAIRPSVGLAEAYGAVLHVLSVVDLAREGGPFSAGGVDEEYVQDLVDERRSALDGFVTGCEEAAEDADALDLELAVRSGGPSEEVGAYVDETDVDLVVIGSTGEGSFTGQLFGSTTDRVLRTVDVPVLVVHAE